MFWLIPVIGIHLILGMFADGNTDDNYRHFAVPKPQNIIMGDSRSSQAVVSSMLANKLSINFDNFSLNIADSPYGEIYFKALQRKIDPKTKNGIFILSVNPWSLSLKRTFKSTEEYPENHSPLHNMYFYDWSPNYEYLLKNYSRSWFKLYLEREETARSNTYLHKDGWMEVNIDMHKDSLEIRLEKKLTMYKLMAKEEQLSNERLKAFDDIINFLQKKGNVYLVRIPASKEVMNIEFEKFPEFNTLMKDISEKKKLHYLDFSNRADDYQYTDGNHMYKESSKKFTAQIGDSITKIERFR